MKLRTSASQCWQPTCGPNSASFRQSARAPALLIEIRVGREGMHALTGKNVAVIGGSRGVGRKVAEAAAGRGAQVLAVSRRLEPLRRFAKETAGIDISRLMQRTSMRLPKCSIACC